MKLKKILTILTVLISTVFVNKAEAGDARSGAAVYKQLSAVKCDSLVKANTTNPDFVILDVRTPAEYNPEHLNGAINRNVSDANFTNWMNQLNKQKIYLLHCASGARSAGAFNTMKSLQFNEVYEMIGGISAWKGAGLAITSAFSSKLMVATKGIDTVRTVKIGKTDTLKIRVTNRANDTLKFNSFVPFTNPEFKTNFDSATKLTGSQDYTFLILFTPADLLEHSVKFTINSNGGTQEFTLTRKGASVSGIEPVEIQKMVLYPNPASGRIFIENITPENVRGISISGLNGETVVRQAKLTKNYLDISFLRNGIYIIQVSAGENSIRRKIMVKNQ